MIYKKKYKRKFQKEMNKLCKRNSKLRKILRNKMEEIVASPERYKPLRYELVGERGVHIMKSFVLRFVIDHRKKIVNFIAFDHHDDAYKR